MHRAPAGEGRGALREGDGDRRPEAREEPDRGAGDGVRLEGDDGAAEGPGRERGADAAVAPEGHHPVHPVAAERRDGARHGAREARGEGEGAEGAAGKAGRRDREARVGRAGAGPGGVAVPVRRREEDPRPRSDRAQALGHGRAGEEVPPGAAAGEEDHGAAHERPSDGRSWPPSRASAASSARREAA